MSRIVWDEIGKRFFETGVSHGVLYPMADDGTYPRGVGWSGLTSVSESPSGADANKQWADDINYLTLYGVEEYGATIEAFAYPDEFAECDGSAELVQGVYICQQPRRAFGFSYRSRVGNDIVGQDFAYILHLIYGGRAAPSSRDYETINDNPEAMTMSWELSTTPVVVTGHKPTSCLKIDSRQFTTEAARVKLAAFEDIIYGSENAEPRLPLPDEVKTLLSVD